MSERGAKATRIPDKIHIYSANGRAFFCIMNFAHTNGYIARAKAMRKLGCAFIAQGSFVLMKKKEKKMMEVLKKIAL